MSNGMEPGGRKAPNPLEPNPFAEGTLAEKLKADAQAEADAVLAEKIRLRDQQGGSSSKGGHTSLSKAQQDITAATYYQAKPGTCETEWPPVTNNSVHNALYVSLAVTMHLKNATMIP